MLEKTRSFFARATMVAAGFVVVGALAATAPPAEPRVFAEENRAAMDRMMQGMEVAPSGDVDRDFARMMIAHHQGAIDMARAELRHGRDRTMRRLAQGIVVEQRQEIDVMGGFLGDPAVASKDSALHADGAPDVPRPPPAPNR